MPWVWVALVLAVWALAAIAVIALCLSVRQTDARLGRDREDVGDARNDDSRPSREAKVE